MKYTTVIFDMDGTLLDTLDDLADAVSFTMDKFQMPQHSREDIREFVASGVYRLIEYAVPDGRTNSRFAEASETFEAYYTRHGQERTKPFPGIMNLLSSLKKQGYKLAVVSNKYDSAVKLLAASYFPAVFDIMVGEHEGVRRKPAPDSVIEVMRELNVSTNETIYIGDSDVDIKTAENAGIDCISVSWGFRGKAFLREHGAKIIVDTPEEISAVIEKR